MRPESREHRGRHERTASSSFEKRSLGIWFRLTLYCRVRYFGVLSTMNKGEKAAKPRICRSRASILQLTDTAPPKRPHLAHHYKPKRGYRVYILDSLHEHPVCVCQVGTAHGLLSRWKTEGKRSNEGGSSMKTRCRVVKEEGNRSRSSPHALENRRLLLTIFVLSQEPDNERTAVYRFLLGERPASS